MKYRILNIVIITVALFLPCIYTFAQTIEPRELIKNVNASFGKNSFTGIKNQQVIRQDMTLNAKADVVFMNKNNFQITLKDPISVNGIMFYTDDSKLVAYLPDSLYFFNTSKTGIDIPIEVILGKVTNDITLLENNYSAVLMNNDKIGKRNTYVLDLQPRNGFNTPGRRYWIDQENYQILRQERYWDPNYASYFTSYYEEINFENVSKISFTPKSNIKNIDFNPKKDNFFESYINAANAEKSCKQKIFLPSTLPSGFLLKDIQVIRLFETNIIMLYYSDGLNSLWVTYRKEANFFLTLAAGIFSLSLLQKLGDLSYHIPYNYYSNKKDNNLVIAFGDLFPEDMEKVVNSLSFK